MDEPLSVGWQATAQNQFPGSFSYFYDADGNMTQNGGAHYTYDAEDRLMSAAGWPSLSLHLRRLGMFIRHSKS